MFGYFKRRRRERIKSQSFPQTWRDLIAKNVPIWHRLPEVDQRELISHVQVFLAEKHFEGCGGLAIDDEIKLTIAANACVLLLHRLTDYFPRLVSILVYPSSFLAPTSESLGAGIVIEGEEPLLGQAWKEGVVVLSWKEIKWSSRGDSPGNNLVLHEFAHQLDMEDGTAEGTPLLDSKRQYITWKEVLAWEYERLQRDDALGRYSVLDTYGATNPAEFFAVATEAFFEKSRLLSRRHPELYAELRSYFRQDPDRWLDLKIRSPENPATNAPLNQSKEFGLSTPDPSVS